MRDATPSEAEEPYWFQNRQRKIAIDEAGVRAFLARAAREVARNREFAVVIGSPYALRRANTQFRGKHSTTDVLSFPDGADGRLGDILISAGRAASQAEAQGHPVEEELKILILHGLLHLLGHDHETDAGEMRRIEQRWRRKLGLEAGLIERSSTSAGARERVNV